MPWLSDSKHEAWPDSKGILVRDILNYVLATVLLLATVPLYRYIIERGSRPEPVTPSGIVTPAPVPPPKAPVALHRSISVGAPGRCDAASMKPALRNFVITDQVSCALVMGVIAALERGEARCLGGQVYAVHKNAGVLDVRPWDGAVTCAGG